MVVFDLVILIKKEDKEFINLSFFSFYIYDNLVDNGSYFCYTLY